MEGWMYGQTNGWTALSVVEMDGLRCQLLLADVSAEGMSYGVYKFTAGSNLTCQCHICKCHARSPLLTSLLNPAFSSCVTCAHYSLKMHFLAQSVKQHCLSSHHNSNINHNDNCNNRHYY